MGDYYLGYNENDYEVIVNGPPELRIGIVHK